jgi:hypothetical protein
MGQSGSQFMVFSLVGGFRKVAELMVAEKRGGRHLLMGEKEVGAEG